MVRMEVEEEALRIHKESIVVDAHCDTIFHLADRPFKPDWRKRRLGVRDTAGHIDIPRLIDGGVDCQFFAIFVEAFYRPERALIRVLELIDSFQRELDENKAFIGLALSYDDVVEANRRGRIASLLSLEGGDAVQGGLAALRVLYRLGVRALSLTHNERNMLADGVSEARARGGLTSMGVQVVEEMNRLGIILDVSHLSESSFWDALEVCRGPLIASHSNCRHLCDSPRNLTDEQIKAIADKGGVVGVSFSPSFLVKDGRATVKDVLNHVEHIVKVAGIDYVGLGSDFDGISSTPEGLEDVAKLPKITLELLKRGFSEGEVKKVLGENFLRVMRQVIG